MWLDKVKSGLGDTCCVLPMLSLVLNRVTFWLSVRIEKRRIMLLLLARASHQRLEFGRVDFFAFA